MILHLPDLRDLEERVDEFIESLPCRAPGPYPPVKVKGPHPQYAQMLLDAFADGAAAELTAITQYFNHYLVNPDKEVARLQFCIALVEMEHLELLGELIEQLGGDPRYWRSNKAYWDGGNVAYGVKMTPSELLRLDIEGEICAIEAYERLITEIADPGVRRVLERIVEDERVHLDLFETALAHLAK
ncbi:MAG: bacterioferritin [Firmicutes bacterium]|nr:bacterioferritin [Bacillota bacterium]